MSVAARIADWLAMSQVRALETRYREPWRQYHDWSHPTAMLRHLEAAVADGATVADPAAAVGFVLWHDAIYDPQATHGRNERLSAALCAAEMPALADAASVAHAVVAIEATIGHVLPDHAVCPDGALLLDIDLAVLGAGADAFAAYDRGIAAEYAHVAPDVYRVGRAAVLRRFLERDRLYLTDWGHARWEQAARTNLARAIEALETGP